MMAGTAFATTTTGLDENTDPQLTDWLYIIDISAPANHRSHKILWGTLLDDTKGAGDTAYGLSADKIIELLALKQAADDDLTTYAGITPSANAQAMLLLTYAQISTALHLDDVVTLTGVLAEAVHLGTFTGTTIDDSVTIKAAIQALETALELRVLTTDINTAAKLETVANLGAYADTLLGFATAATAADTLAASMTAGALTDNSVTSDDIHWAEPITVPFDNKLQFGDTGIYIWADDDGILDIVADTSVDITNLKLASDLDATDYDITSVDKVEGFDSGVFIDLGQDSQILFSSDGAGTPFATPDLDFTGTSYFDDDIGLPIDTQLYFGDTAVYIESDDDGYLDLEADTGIRLNQNTAINGALDVGSSTISMSSAAGVLTMLGTHTGFDESLSVDLDGTDNTAVFGGSAATWNLGSINLITTGTISGRPVITSAGTERVLTTKECNGGIVLVTAAVEVRLIDCSASTVGANVMLVQADVSEVFEIAVTDTDDHLFLDGADLGANQEIDSPGDAVEDQYIVMVCRETNEWHSFGRSGTFVDGGSAN